jgi:hypothetical protein
MHMHVHMHTKSIPGIFWDVHYVRVLVPLHLVLPIHLHMEALENPLCNLASCTYRTGLIRKHYITANTNLTGFDHAIKRTDSERVFQLAHLNWDSREWSLQTTERMVPLKPNKVPSTEVRAAEPIRQFDCRPPLAPPEPS